MFAVAIYNICANFQLNIGGSSAYNVYGRNLGLPETNRYNIFFCLLLSFFFSSDDGRFRLLETQVVLFLTGECSKNVIIACGSTVYSSREK